MNSRLSCILHLRNRVMIRRMHGVRGSSVLTTYLTRAATGISCNRSTNRQPSLGKYKTTEHAILERSWINRLSEQRSSQYLKLSGSTIDHHCFTGQHQSSTCLTTLTLSIRFLSNAVCKTLKLLSHSQSFLALILTLCIGRLPEGE